MSDKSHSSKPGDASRFAQQAQQAPTGLFREFWLFLAHNKKWWLLPILAILALMAGLIILANPAVAPFIYTLF